IGFRARPLLASRTGIHKKEPIHIRQSHGRVRGGELRVDFDGPFEHLQSRLVIARSEPAAQYTTSEIVIVSQGIDAALSTQGGLLFRAETNLDSRGDRARDVGLQFEDVAHLTFVAFSPEISFRSRIDELSRDPYAI